MYRVLVNIDYNPSSRILLSDIKDLTIISEAFFKIATGKDYRLEDAYQDSDILDDIESHFHYTLGDHSIWFRVKRCSK